MIPRRTFQVKVFRHSLLGSRAPSERSWFQKEVSTASPRVKARQTRCFHNPPSREPLPGDQALQTRRCPNNRHWKRASLLGVRTPRQGSLSNQTSINPCSRLICLNTKTTHHNCILARAVGHVSPTIIRASHHPQLIHHRPFNFTPRRPHTTRVSIPNSHAQSPQRQTP